jgi:hypothetical protein
MNRAHRISVAIALFVVGLVAAQALAQQVVVQPSNQTAPVRTRSVQPTRQYRSYSVNPSRSEVRRNGPHSGEATWRHAGAKPSGHYATGR